MNISSNAKQRTPIVYSGTPESHLPTHYGTHHQLYRIDGELVAMSVLDILPGGVSGVYFMYSSKWEHCQLGKVCYRLLVCGDLQCHTSLVCSVRLL